MMQKITVPKFYKVRLYHQSPDFAAILVYVIFVLFFIYLDDTITGASKFKLIWKRIHHGIQERLHTF